MHERFDEEEYRAFAAKDNDDLMVYVKQFITIVRHITDNIDQQHWHQNAQLGSKAYEKLLAQLNPVRNNVMSNIAEGNVTVPQATQKIEAIRWLKRVSYHVCRITHHLNLFHRANKG